MTSNLFKRKVPSSKEFLPDSKAHDVNANCSNTTTTAEAYPADTDSSPSEAVLPDESAISSKPSLSVPVKNTQSNASSSNAAKSRLNALIKRCAVGTMLLSTWTFSMINGYLPLVIIIHCIVFRCYYELVQVMRKCYHAEKFPFSRILAVQLLFAAWYYMFGHAFIVLLRNSPIKLSPTLATMIDFHDFISLSIYLSTVANFVINLRKPILTQQFSLFVWYHLFLLILCVPFSQCLTHGVTYGFVWFVYVATMVTINDIGAYFAGFFFGHTPLIEVSPKKTVEGFIGGGILTLLLSIPVAYSMLRLPHYLCPTSLNPDLVSFSYTCETSPRASAVYDACFTRTAHKFPDQTLFPNPCVVKQEQGGVQDSGLINGNDDDGFLEGMMRIKHFYVHAVWLALFCASIAPFGGFFASGFKRGLNLKDFSDLFPGHGGATDRMDCIILGICFTSFYVPHFVSPQDHQNDSGGGGSFSSHFDEKLFGQVRSLDWHDQLKLFNMLKDSFQQRNLLAG